MLWGCNIVESVLVVSRGKVGVWIGWNALYPLEHQSRKPPRTEALLSSAFPEEQRSKEWECLAGAKLWLTPTDAHLWAQKGLPERNAHYTLFHQTPQHAGFTVEVALPAPQVRWAEFRVWLERPQALRVLPPYLWGECCLFSSPPLKKLSGKPQVRAPGQPSTFLSSPNRWRNSCQAWVLICRTLWGLFVAGPTFKAQIQISKVKQVFRDPPSFPRKSSTLK